MKPENDAYGQEIWAYLLKRDSFEVVERDDGFVGQSGGAKNYFAGYNRWPVIERRAIKLARGRILDVGCGAGRVCRFLQRQGLDVTGIDSSPKAVEVCKRRGVRQAMVLPVERIDRFRSGSFDTVVMFGNNFGLFGSYEKAKRLLKKMRTITSEDAIILAESKDPYGTKDPVHLAYHRLNRRRGRMAGQLRIRIRFRQYIGKWFDYLLVSSKEMEDILNGTGWRLRRLIRTRGSPVYIAVIAKSADTD